MHFQDKMTQLNIDEISRPKTPTGQKANESIAGLIHMFILHEKFGWHQLSAMQKGIQTPLYQGHQISHPNWSFLFALTSEGQHLSVTRLSLIERFHYICSHSIGYFPNKFWV
jgi:hypothetical protein